MRTRVNRIVGVGVVVLLLCACGSNGGPGDGEGTGDGGGTGDGSANGDVPGGGLDTPGGGGDVPGVDPDGGVVVTDDGGTFVCHVTSCGGHVNECGDCLDNDRDGRIDSRDPECLGPCDNTEGPTLLTGVGGEAGGPCQSDCYFDYGNGPGNDDCQWSHRCDPLSVAPNFYPEGSSCAYDARMVGGRDCPATQSMQCHNFCRPLTPNGCDCFGCCTFPQLAGRGPGGGPGFVWLGSRDTAGNGSCTIAGVTDPMACHPCTPVADCYNECGPCEVCLGRPMPPPECFMSRPDAGTTDSGGTIDSGGPPPPARCAPGIQPCGLAGDSPCPTNAYCITGCCQIVPG
jgi:hypothetical protein